MSSASCPDCGCQFLKKLENKTGKAKASCGLCGWEGLVDFGFREELTEEGYSRCDEKLQRKEDGKLFFLRFYPVGQKELGSAMDVVMKMLGMDMYSTSDSGYAYVQLSQRPTEELLARLRSVKGLAKVTVF